VIALSTIVSEQNRLAGGRVRCNPH